MRIQAGQHAVDRLGNELRVVDRFDIVIFDAAKYFREGAQILDRQRARAFLRHGGKVQADQHAKDRPEDDQANLPKFALHLHDSSCAQPDVARSYFNVTQGMGSKGFP